jgi:hypothetical protein
VVARHKLVDFGLPRAPAKAIKDLEAGDGFSAKNAITAHAGGGQGSATVLDEAISRVVTVASGNDSVVLPAAKAGMVRVVKNAHASNSMNVFPYSGDAINALSANSAYAVAATKVVMFVCAVDGTWDTLLTA